MKTIVLEEDPPLWKKTGGLLVYPSPPTPPQIEKIVSCFYTTHVAPLHHQQ